MTKLNFKSVLVFISIFIATPTKIFSQGPYEVVLGWKSIDYTFPSAQARLKAIRTGEFIPMNNIIAGIKVHGTRVFLTTPRWYNGVPSTLSVANLQSLEFAGSPTPSPLLEPYPSWDMQKIGNCSSFQFIQSMEIDKFGRMWILDVGRVNLWAEDPSQIRNLCPGKLVIMDLKTNTIIKTHIFPENVVQSTNNFLNDIAIACDDNDREKCWGYISDPIGQRIVAYNLQKDKSHFVTHSTLIGNTTVTNTGVPITGVDGIALSPKDSNHDQIYFTPVSEPGTYRVPTAVVRDTLNGATLRDSDIVSIFNRSGQTGGIAMDSRGLMYFGRLHNFTVTYVDTISPGGLDSETILAKNEVDINFPDTFAIDNSGYFYMVTNRLSQIQDGTVDWADTNFRVVRVYIGAKSYMYSSAERTRPTRVRILRRN